MGESSALFVAPFKRGDTIEWMWELYRVLDNYGTYGTVVEIGSGDAINHFYWEFMGEVAKLVTLIPVTQQGT